MAQDSTVSGVVIDHQHAEIGQITAAGFGRPGVAGRLVQLHRKPESGAFARVAFHADLTLHEGYQLLADRQTQAGAAEFARGRTIGLVKRLKELSLSFGGNANAAVLDLESNLCVRPSFTPFGNPNDHLTFAREFQGVPD